MLPDLLRSLISLMMIVYFVECYPYWTLFDKKPPSLSDLDEDPFILQRRSHSSNNLFNLLQRNYESLSLERPKPRNQRKDYSNLIDSILFDQMGNVRSKRGPGGCDIYNGCGK